MRENYLKQIREQMNISQSVLAAKVGVTKQLISGFEQKRSGISNEVLRKISDVLGVSPDAILTGKSLKPFDESGRQKLTEAMSLAFKFYGDQFDKDFLIKIATEIYGLMIDFDFAKTDELKTKFKNSLEEKVVLGLAAKALIDSSNQS